MTTIRLDKPWLAVTGRCLVIALAACMTVGVATAQAKEACFPSLMTHLKGEVDGKLYPGFAMLVDRGGEIILDKRHGHLTAAQKQALPADAIYRLYSMTKPVTSVATMILLERGKLRLNDALSQYIPEFGAVKVHTEGGLVEAQNPITIRDLLRHTSGITYEFFGEGAARDAYRAAGIGSSLDITNEQAAKDLAAMPLEHQPGTAWEYSRSTDVLGRVVEVASGQPLDVFFKKNIFTPLGMTDTDFFIPAEKQSRAAGALANEGSIGMVDHFTNVAYHSAGGGPQGLVSTMSDYLRFLRMLRNDGELDGVRVLQAESVAEMRTDQLFANGIKPGKYYFVGWGHGFGLGFAVKLEEHPEAWAGPVGTYFWMGYAGTLFWIDPANDLIAMYLMQRGDNNLARWAAVRSLFYQDYGLDGSAAASCLTG